MSEAKANCARCAIEMAERLCKTETGRSPEGCPTGGGEDARRRSDAEYRRPEVREFARQASIQEGVGYGDKHLGYARVKPIKPRIQEVMEFAERMNYRRLGLAFCMGLRREAKIVEKLFSEHGFEMVSVVCKVGRAPKEEIDLAEEEKIEPGVFETMCNPIMQAMTVNDAMTDFNLMLGLCVGHDSLFLKYAQAPCTVLAVKDRVTGHNPLAAVYNLDSYWRSLK